MKKAIHLIIYIAASALLLAGCSEGASGPKRMPRPSDTIYTLQHAMDVYGYQPERALRIIDSAVVVGNLSEPEAEFNRAKIYSWTFMREQMDSLLHGPDGVRYDSARAIGERLLEHDITRDSLPLRQQVLEVLLYVVRQQQDTAVWLQRARELVDVCHQQGPEAETEALRTEAELGAVECVAGQRRQGMARLDSALARLDNGQRSFNELDATIIALKRKMHVLNQEGRYVEAIPVARRILERLDDYERHPADYHDGSSREPADSASRVDYIDFYRTQAQSRITTAYALLGEMDNLNESFERMERGVRETTARSYIARYRMLEQQMLRIEAENRSQRMTMIAVGAVVVLVFLLLFATHTYFQNRRIRKKNLALVRLMEQQPAQAPTPASAPTPAQAPLPPTLFHDIDTAIRTERLYAANNFQRQDVCERFGIRREALNQLLTDHVGGPSFPNYVNSIRLSEARRLLSTESAMTVNAIAEEVGLSPRNLRRLFVDQYGMTPTEFREGLSQIGDSRPSAERGG